MIVTIYFGAKYIILVLFKCTQVCLSSDIIFIELILCMFTIDFINIYIMNSIHVTFITGVAWLSQARVVKR